MHRIARLLFAGILLLLVPRPGLTTTPIVLANPGFESGVSPWHICGGATHVDAQVAGANAVHSGRYAIQLQNPSTTVGCPSPPPGYEYMGLTPQALWQEVTIPADTPAVTVSFWYWVDGLPRTDLDVYLASNMYKFSAGFGGADLGRISPYLLPGWQLFRYVLTPDELAKVRGKTLWLAFRLYDPLGANDTLTFRIDDVQVVGADVRTTAAPLPAALRGDGSQPLAFIREDAANSYRTRLYRMDTDGRNLHLMYPGQLSDVGRPVWSHSGRNIALIDGNTYPPGETNPDKYVPATALVVVNADGSNPRPIYQTTGIPGSPCPPTTTEYPDFIQQLTNVSWSPDDRVLAASIFAYNRYCSGRLEGGLARIERIDAATGASTRLLDYATTPHWGTNNRLLFEAYDLVGSNRGGSIWDLDLGVQPPAEHQLLSGKGFDEDNDPVWHPDGRRFATIRPTGSYRYDADGNASRNQALMLFDRQNLASPRMLLLADHGGIRHPTWSPDGTYLIYTLIHASATDIWWLDVATGATGPITTDGLSSDANWRPACPGLAGVRRNSVCAGVGQRSYLPLVQR
jgi:Tol biopolymer transport system component